MLWKILNFEGQILIASSNITLKEDFYDIQFRLLLEQFSGIAIFWRDLGEKFSRKGQNKLQKGIELNIGTETLYLTKFLRLHKIHF